MTSPVPAQEESDFAFIRINPDPSTLRPSQLDGGSVFRLIRRKTHTYTAVPPVVLALVIAPCAKAR